VERKEGHRFVSVTWPGLVGVLSGMNEKGLAIANLPPGGFLDVRDSLAALKVEAVNLQRFNELVEVPA